jgi:hypothetical protein
MALQSSKKRESRKSLSQPGWITLEGGFAARQCVVQDLSTTGAKVTIDDPNSLPAKLRLAFSRDARTGRRCEVVWRRGKSVGVKFVRWSGIDPQAAIKGGMRKSLMILMAVALPAVAAAAEQPRLQKSDKAATSGKPLPMKRSNSANACAEYGAGFVKIEGTNTCMKIGGAVSVGAGVSSGSRWQE